MINLISLKISPSGKTSFTYKVDRGSLIPSFISEIVNESNKHKYCKDFDFYYENRFYHFSFKYSNKKELKEKVKWYKPIDYRKIEEYLKFVSFFVDKTGKMIKKNIIGGERIE